MSKDEHEKLWKIVKHKDKPPVVTCPYCKRPAQTVHGQRSGAGLLQQITVWYTCSCEEWRKKHHASDRK